MTTSSCGTVWVESSCGNRHPGLVSTWRRSHPDGEWEATSGYPRSSGRLSYGCSQGWADQRRPIPGKSPGSGAVARLSRLRGQDAANSNACSSVHGVASEGCPCRPGVRRRYASDRFHAMPARRGTWCSATVLALRPSPSWWIGSVRRRAAGAAEAAAAGDIVGVTVPLKASRPVPVEPLRGKPVIDINNYYPDRDGHIAELDDESTTVTEARCRCCVLLQDHLPESRVVRRSITSTS